MVLWLKCFINVLSIFFDHTQVTSTASEHRRMAQSAGGVGGAGNMVGGGEVCV